MNLQFPTREEFEYEIFNSNKEQQTFDSNKFAEAAKESVAFNTVVEADTLFDFGHLNPTPEQLNFAIGMFELGMLIEHNRHVNATQSAITRKRAYNNPEGDCVDANDADSTHVYQSPATLED